jgi:hypothetical protein
MAGKGDFTAEEWDILQRALVGAALLVAAADGGKSDLGKELVVIAQQLRYAKATQGSHLVAELADLTNARTGFTASMSMTDIEGPTLDALRSAVATIAAKAEDELVPFKHFVLGLSEATARAARSRLFGLAGSRVSKPETAAINRIKEALELLA